MVSAKTENNLIVLDMDQIGEVQNYKNLLRSGNFSRYFLTTFNFSGAEEIFGEFLQNLSTIQEFTTVVLLTLYVIIFVVAFMGNSLILAAAVQGTRPGKTKNLFLANLAVADLTVTLICMPTTVGTIVYTPWIYGRAMCKLTSTIQGVAVAVSIFSLTAMSVDRYVSILHPGIPGQAVSGRQAGAVIAGMWIVSSVFMGPMTFIKDIDKVRMPHLPVLEFCVENWPRESDRQAYGLFLLFVVCIIPSGTLIICYLSLGRRLCTVELTRETSDGSTRGLFSRKRAARMLIVLVIAFMVCWLPYNITSISSDLTNQRSSNSTLLYFTLWLGHAHSAINPVMFWLLNKRFRERVRYMLRYLKGNCLPFDSEALPVRV